MSRTIWVQILDEAVCISHRTNHHHHVVPLARISLTLSRHFSLSFIASRRSSGLHPLYFPYIVFFLNRSDYHGTVHLAFDLVWVSMHYANTLVPDIGLAVRVFANGPGDLGSIPGRVIPKTQKMVLDPSLLNTQHYKVRIKGKVEQSREGVAPSPTPWCSSYRKGSLRVTLDYGRQLYLLTYC